MAVELDRVAFIGSGSAPEPRDIANTSGIGSFAHLLIGIRSGIQVELFKGPKVVSNLQYTMIAHTRADIAVEDAAAFFTITGVGRAA
jgi:hypothetical protein